MEKHITARLFVVLFVMQVIIVSCEKDTVLIERTANAVWCADDSEILKVVSIYETDAPEEVYYYSPSAKNWKYRFEKCTPDLSEHTVIGYSDDIDFGGTLAYSPLFWLPKVKKICTINPYAKAVLKDMQGDEILLEIPVGIYNNFFSETTGSFSAHDLAPSPNEEVVAVTFGSPSITSDNFIILFQCISFFEVQTGNHLYTREIDFFNIRPQLNVSYPDFGRRWDFLWSKNSTGVYMITKSKAYFISYGNYAGVKEVDLVPERPVKTNSGRISNSGNLLRILKNGNETTLDIVHLDDWIPFDSLEFVPKETNTYSMW